MTRADLLNFLIQVRGYHRYLEIGGFGEHHNLHLIQCAHKFGVGSKLGATFQGTSDDFFQQNQEEFDLVSVDGLHPADQVEKDISSALACLAPGGAVVIHNCFPTDAWQW